MSLISYRNHPTALKYPVVDRVTTTLSNPNATDTRITIPRSDDEFTCLFGTVLIITFSVVNADRSDLDTDINNVTV